MKIRRGPSEKSRDDYRQVCKSELSEQVCKWNKVIELGPFNLSYGGASRQAHAYITFEREDVLGLFDGLLKGLISRSDQLDDVWLERIKLQTAMRKIIDANSIEEIKKLARKALKAGAGKNSKK